MDRTAENCAANNGTAKNRAAANSNVESRARMWREALLADQDLFPDRRIFTPWAGAARMFRAAATDRH